MSQGGDDQAQERTEAPTPRRLEQARRKGQVPRSRELNTMAVMLTGAAGMLALGSSLTGGTRELLVTGLSRPGRGEFEAADAPHLLLASVLEAVWMLSPLLLILLAAAFAGPALLGGLVVSAEAARPKFNRLNPVNGLKRIFSPQGLMELGKTLLKFAVLTSMSVTLLWLSAEQLLSLGRGTAAAGLARAGGLVQLAFLVLAAGLILIAAVDAPFQLWNHMRRLRMTRREIKDELKETEGSPEMRSKVRRIQQETASRRMMSEVPDADVVLTNPTSFAVALKYTDRPDRAPRVVAKGCDLVAGRIRELAGEHGVTVCQAPALTRAIYFNTRLGEEIPAALYLAVARVLAYVFELKARPDRPAPEFPTDLPVPEDLAAAAPDGGPEGAGGAR